MNFAVRESIARVKIFIPAKKRFSVVINVFLPSRKKMWVPATCSTPLPPYSGSSALNADRSEETACKLAFTWMGHGYCSARRAVRPRELPLICTYARLVLPLCLHERISLQTGIGRSKIQTITIGSLTDRQHVFPARRYLAALHASYNFIVRHNYKKEKNNLRDWRTIVCSRHTARGKSSYVAFVWKRVTKCACYKKKEHEGVKLV